MSALVRPGESASIADLAAAFWELDSAQQAEFFAELHRIAGVTLCIQTAFIVEEIAERSRAGDNDARDGFLRMLAHANEYGLTAIDLHVRHAKRELARFVAGVKL